MQGSLQKSFSVKMASAAVPQNRYYSRVVLFSYCFLVFVVVDFISKFGTVNGEISRSTMMELNSINKEGPYLGIIVPNAFEMNPLLDSSSFQSHPLFPFLDFSGKRFRIGRSGPEKIIIVLTGMGMLNAGITTQLLLSLFKVKGVLHYGVAGNANPELQIGDVTIPRFWAHTGLWNWQRYGDGPDDKLAFESDGSGITRKIGYLNVSDYTNQTLENNSSSDNLLNNIWYQPEEIFPVNGTPEVNQNAFWVPVNSRFYELAKSLKNVKLERCVNTTCLPRTPKVVRVQSGISASIVLDNKAYREFLQSKFNATPVDMETAAVALVCHQQDVPFIALRSLSDLAGGGSAESNESAIFSSLAAKNAVTALLRFIPLLSSKMFKFQESAPKLL